MAAFTVNVPDQHTDNAIRGVANAMTGDRDPAMAAIANKVVAGTATTALEKKALAEAFCQRQIWQAFINTVAGDAANTVRNTPGNIW